VQHDDQKPPQTAAETVLASPPDPTLPPQSTPFDPTTPLKITTFAHAKTNKRRARATTWQDLIRNLAEPLVVDHDDKLRLPLLSPAEWRAEHRSKSADGVERIWFATLDFDHLTQEALDRVCDAAEGLATCLYTTWSHPQQFAETGLWSFRLMVPLSRPVEASEWEAFYPRLWTRLGCLADTACTDPSRSFFIPATKEADPLAAHALTIATEGAALDVDAVLGLPEPPEGWKRQAAQQVTRLELEELAGRLAKRAGTVSKQVAASIKAALRNEPYATTERDNATWDLAVALARQWPDAEPSAIAHHFGPSLEAIRQAATDPKNPPPTLDTLCEKIARCQRNQRDEHNDRKRQNEQRQKVLLLKAFGGQRDTPYTASEVQGFADAQGVSLAEFQRHWIVQAGSTYYLFKDGQYVWPRQECELLTGALVELSPASTAGVTVHKVTSQGELRQKKPTELMAEYGSQAKEVIADLAAQKSTYDPRTQIITEAPCPLRNLSPLQPDSPIDDERVAFEQINEWLRLLGGEMHDKLLDWIALAPNLKRPIAALYFGGQKAAGRRYSPSASRGFGAMAIPRPWRTCSTTFKKTF
jgi:hypothetical protein